MRRCPLRSSQCIRFGVRLGLVFVAVALAVCGLGLAALPACGTTELHFPGADAGADAGGAPDPCTCVLRPYTWDGRAWVWIGSDPTWTPFMMIACPPGSAGVAQDLHGGQFHAESACPLCTCLPS